MTVIPVYPLCEEQRSNDHVHFPDYTLIRSYIYFYFSYLSIVDHIRIYNDIDLIRSNNLI